MEMSAIGIANVCSDASSSICMKRGEQSSFSQVLDRVAGFAKESEEIIGNIKGVEEKILSGERMQLKDIVAFQVSAARYSLSVELISRVVESGLSTIRRLQSGQ